MDCEFQRRSIRLKGYDYTSTGAYFVTVCAHAREPLFEDPALKEILKRTWCSQQERFPKVSLDAFVVMPNHVHLIVWLNAVGAPLAGAHPPHPPRAGTSPAPTTDVGARLAGTHGVGAPLADAHPPHPLQAGASPAPTTDVGAPLAGAHGVGAFLAATRNGKQTIRAGTSPAPTLGQVVGAFKSIVATKWLGRNAPHRSEHVWQRNYYERVIRDEEELNRAREYILLNPFKWEFDRENPTRVANSEYQEQWDWLEAGEPEMARSSWHTPVAEKRR